MHKRRIRDTVLNDGPLPRYAQLSALLRTRIERGLWRDGMQLPTLAALTEEFGVARVTARQAINLLVRDGLVSAQRGRGTFVTGTPARRGRLALATTLDALADVYRNDEPHLTLIDEASATPELRSGDGAAAARYHFMRRVHSRDGEPYCVISIYLDDRVFRRAPQRFRRHTVIPVLLDLRGIKISRAWQTLSIGSADVEVARQIGVAVNSPVAEVRRVCCDAEGTVIYLGEVTYRGDYIHLEMDLEP